METSADASPVTPVDNGADVKVAVFVLFGRVVQSPIKLTQDKREFRFEFCNFAVRLYFYIVWPSVLSLKNIKLHKT